MKLNEKKNKKIFKLKEMMKIKFFLFFWFDLLIFLKKFY
jgi:hypothetical protein